MFTAPPGQPGLQVTSTQNYEHAKLLAELLSLLAAAFVWFLGISLYMHSLTIRKWFAEKLHADSISLGSLFSVFMVHQALATLYPELQFF